MNARRPEAGGVGRGGAPKVRPETKKGDDGLRKTAGLALGFVPGRQVRAVHPVRTAHGKGQRGGGTQTVSGMGAGAPAAPPPFPLTDAQGRGQRRDRRSRSREEGPVGKRAEPTRWHRAQPPPPSSGNAEVTFQGTNNTSYSSLSTHVHLNINHLNHSSNFKA